MITRHIDDIPKTLDNWDDFNRAVNAYLDGTLPAGAATLDRAFYDENFGSQNKVEEYILMYAKTRPKMPEPEISLDDMEKAQEVISSLR